MRMRWALLALAATVLSACYTSDKLLLDPRQAAAPLALGHQTTAGGDDPPKAVEISLEPDRWYRVLADGDNSRILFTPMTGGPSGVTRYAFAVGEHENFLYGVAERRDGRIYFDLPFCDLGPARDAAITHGVAAPAKGDRKALAPVCKFTEAASLLGALGDYADRPDKKNPVNLPAAN